MPSALPTKEQPVAAPTDIILRLRFAQDERQGLPLGMKKCMNRLGFDLDSPANRRHEV